MTRSSFSAIYWARTAPHPYSLKSVYNTISLPYIGTYSIGFVAIAAFKVWKASS